MALTPNDSSLSSDEDINQFLVCRWGLNSRFLSIILLGDSIILFKVIYIYIYIYSIFDDWIWI